MIIQWKWERFKGLDLIDRVPDELWMEVHDIVQETGIKTISKKKEIHESKMAVWEGLTNSCEKKRSKKQRRKGEKERFTDLNVEFQRIARKDKKAFLRDQCKESKENNRMKKTRDLFKKIRDTKGIFQAKMGSIKDKNCMDLSKQKILRRSGKNAQKNCTKKFSWPR